MSNTAEIVYLGELRCQLRHVRSGQTFVTDAPPDNQGKGEAFSPTDLLATSLLACIITTLGIAMKLGRLPAADMKGSVAKIMHTDPRRVGEIQIRLEISGASFTEQERQKLEHIAHTCPVARSLHPDTVQAVEFVYV